MLDPDDDTLHTYRVRDGQLQLQTVLPAVNGAVLVERPFAVTLDLPALFA